jgi:hypothetical protein
MSDFTGLFMQDHFRAITQERERLIAQDAWRRKWRELHGSDADVCCSADVPSCESARMATRPAAGLS